MSRVVHILLVEDEPEQVRLMQHALQGQPDGTRFLVDHAASRDEAVRMLEASRYDVAVLDLSAVGGTGVRATNAWSDIRRAGRERNPQFDVIVYTASASADVLDKLRLIGASVARKTDTSPSDLAALIRDTIPQASGQPGMSGVRVTGWSVMSVLTVILVLWQTGLIDLGRDALASGTNAAEALRTAREAITAAQAAHEAARESAEESRRTRASLAQLSERAAGTQATVEAVRMEVARTSGQVDRLVDALLRERREPGR
jgi:CheY-like chemotaxis protein